jgi:hypothetical protein
MDKTSLLQSKKKSKARRRKKGKKKASRSNSRATSITELSLYVITHANQVGDSHQRQNVRQRTLAASPFFRLCFLFLPSFFPGLSGLNTVRARPPRVSRPFLRIPGYQSAACVRACVSLVATAARRGGLVDKPGEGESFLHSSRQQRLTRRWTSHSPPIYGTALSVGGALSRWVNSSSHSRA